MWLFDFITDLVALLLWLRATSFRTQPSARPRAISPLASIQPVDRLTPSLWAAAGILLLLFGRSMVYWKIGSAVSWSPTLNLPSVALPFRSDLFTRMIALSFLTFGISLYLFYTSALVLLSLAPGLAGKNPPLDYLRRETRVWGEFPKISCAIFPFLCGFLFWILTRPVWVSFQLLPASHSWKSVLKEAAVLGLNAYIPLQYILYVLLGFAFMNSSIFFGTNAVIQILVTTSTSLIHPLRKLPLTFGKWDLRPILLIILISFTQYFARIALWQLFRGFLVNP
jgi:uncharacterized protein YggT (Ycf19 family)